MINDYVKSRFPIFAKRIIGTKEITDYDPPIEHKITKIGKIKNISSRKAHKEYIGGVFHKSIFYY